MGSGCAVHRNLRAEDHAGHVPRCRVAGCALVLARYNLMLLLHWGARQRAHRSLPVGPAGERQLRLLVRHRTDNHVASTRLEEMPERRAAVPLADDRLLCWHPWPARPRRLTAACSIRGPTTVCSCPGFSEPQHWLQRVPLVSYHLHPHDAGEGDALTAPGTRSSGDHYTLAGRTNALVGGPWASLTRKHLAEVAVPVLDVLAQVLGLEMGPGCGRGGCHARTLFRCLTVSRGGVCGFGL